MKKLFYFVKMLIKQRYSRSTFQKAYSLSSSNHQQSARDKLYRKRYETNSLKLKIIQHCKQISLNTPDSPNDEVFRTPNTTIDADDSVLDAFSTPLGDFSMLKMKSMNNLLDEIEMMHTESLSRMKSMSQLEKENGDTPVDLVKLKKDFENNRFNDAKMQSLSNLEDGHDDIDGMINRRNHSDTGPSPELDRRSLQTPKIFKRVGNTKYIGADSVEDKNYQLMKMRSLGTINIDNIGNNMKNSKSFDPFWNANKVDVGKKYDKSAVVPIRLEERLAEKCEKCDKNDEVFKVPENSMLPLRKERSSPCIESTRNRGSTLYDRLR